MRLARKDFARALARTFAAQGTWNYGSYMAGGLAFSLLPLLERIHAGDPVGLRQAMDRHLRPFNAHPYLMPLAVGALARLEFEGEDPERIERFRTALSSSLGAVGDRLVWQAWRPFWLLVSVLAYSLGLGPWAAVLLFLFPYNAGHVVLRAWGLRRGWEEGLGVGRTISAPWIRRTARLLAGVDVVLLGAVTVALVAKLQGGGLPLAARALVAAAMAASGIAWPGVVGAVTGALAALAGVVAWLPG
ncbi:MAG: PTS system mannose/fructose/sorbose family transporter subunit IID [Candidatus Palauibacterales bacterium]|nr:PTS system mannose/fructose/sorbose family transporter subunit IID [Candidatus Palauibacterales bacterium]MDP2530200.1 PTS system mannose/fructose/sorbose family transporter subunit IID [Candidatus Palauibacterales bacterium]MDP2584585.1 PTS system mannose/fructose/sorbose family transporter subunit IID [Candidatus Palauibacterales bacterium]